MESNFSVAVFLDSYLNTMFNLFSFRSLSPLRRQVIMESSDSLVSASSLPPKIVENPDYLPPALPPKRHRTNIKLNNLNVTPPSSPKFIGSETESPAVSHHNIIAASTNDLSSQNSNNNNSLIGNNNNYRNTMPTKFERPPPQSPSSNYVQISTSTINAAAAEMAKQNNGEPTSTIVVIPAAATTTTKPTAAAVAVPAPPTTASSTSNKTAPIVNSVTDVKSSAVNNDVRVIYTNVNNLFTNTTNNRSSGNDAPPHYMQMYDGGAHERSKSNAIAAKIDCDDKMNNSAVSANKENDRCTVQQPQNNSQTINNNNNLNKVNKNSNHAIGINDKQIDDEEDIVVLRRPQASSNSSLKVLISSSSTTEFSFYSFFLLFLFGLSD